MKTYVHASVVLRDCGKVLLVREAKAANRGQWNFPGGHVEPGEAMAAAAVREAKEETCLGVFLNDLIGVYTGVMRSGDQSVRFVFGGHAMTGEAAAGDEITEVRWFPLEDIGNLADEKLVAPKMFKRIVADIENGISWPVSVLSEDDDVDVSVDKDSPDE